MGEHADEALFDMLFGRGAHEDDRPFIRNEVTCKYCNTRGLIWSKNGQGNWKLVYAEDGAEHWCLRPEPTGVTISLPGFDKFKDK